MASSPFYEPPTPPGDPVPPVDTKPLFPAIQRTANAGPSNTELEKWYDVLNRFLNELGDPELEDVRDEIYRYLH